MKRNVLVLVVTVAILFALASLSWATCPEQPNDLGFCDTLHVVPFDSSIGTVHLTLLVTHDSNTFWYYDRWWQDSISGFCIPLTWSHTNPAAYCSLPPYLNTNSLTDTATSVFRDFGGMQNRILDLLWDTRTIDINNALSRVGLGFIAGGAKKKWYEGSRVLLATLTFLVSDTMTICIDTTFIPPAWYFLFLRYDAAGYVPRYNGPVCFEVYPALLHGDANGDGVINASDVVYLINYLFISGPAPQPLAIGDVNCDGTINASDVVYLINYLFISGPPPPC